jgi:hypothetical protein
MKGKHARARHAPGTPRTRRNAIAGLAVTGSTLLLFAVLSPSSPAYGAEAPVGLGTVAAYSVLGGQAVTNTGPSTLSGDLGVSPGTAITGFPPGTAAGSIHAADAPAAQAQSDLVIAYNDAAGRAPTAAVAGDLVGQTLTAGVYKSTGPIGLSGTVTLDAQGDQDAVFIFQVASTLITASASDVAMINGAQACHVFWQIGSSATLGTNSDFTGTIMALTSISVTTGTTVKGRALARNGQVSLDDNVFTMPECETGPPTSDTSDSTSPTTSDTSTSDTPTSDTTTSDTTTSETPPSETPTSPGTSTTDTSTSDTSTSTTPPDTSTSDTPTGTSTTGTSTSITSTTRSTTTRPTTRTATSTTRPTTRPTQTSSRTTGPASSTTTSGTETTESSTSSSSSTESSSTESGTTESSTGPLTTDIGTGTGTGTGSGSGGPANLASTGASPALGATIGLGALLLVVGGAMLVLARTRRRQR